MRIVVSGSHGSGKSTLIADFSSRHPDFEVLPDPFEFVDAAYDEVDAELFFSQLVSSARRLVEAPPRANAIAERGPLDFLAYLSALDSLRRPQRSTDLLRRGAAVTASVRAHVDLLVLLPLSAADGIDVPDGEDLELRQAMDDELLELCGDDDLVDPATVIEIAGSRDSRVRQLEAAVSARTRVG